VKSYYLPAFTADIEVEFARHAPPYHRPLPSFSTSYLLLSRVPTPGHHRRFRAACRSLSASAMGLIKEREKSGNRGACPAPFVVAALSAVFSSRTLGCYPPYGRDSEASGKTPVGCGTSVRQTGLQVPLVVPFSPVKFSGMVGLKGSIGLSGSDRRLGYRHKLDAWCFPCKAI
jgi:hypothetical protein